MQIAVQHGLLTGCASVVLRGQDVIHKKCVGLADPDSGLDFGLDTICRVYCFTKAYVIIAFMTLVEEGRVKLKDPVAKYLPEFRDVKVVKCRGGLMKPKRRITMFHLLTHKSGLGYSASFGEAPHSSDEKSYDILVRAVVAGRIPTLKSFVKRLAKIPLRSHPGEKYNYGFSMDVIGRVCEVISGTTLDQFLRTRIFAPLGMKDTSFAVPMDRLHRLAACYGSAKTHRLLYGNRRARSTWRDFCRIDGKFSAESAWCEGKECSVLSGGGWMPDNQGGLVSTVADTVRFLRMLIGHGVGENGVRILKRKTLALTERHFITGDGGLSGKEIGHGGAATTYWTLDRKMGYAIVWFTQNVDMVEWTDQKVVDPAKADLWRVMFDATNAARGIKRKLSTPTCV
jgi:CubicO group peptidase (beta-lactamase class C family)